MGYWLSIVAASILTVAASTPIEPNASSRDNRPGWEGLNLARTVVGGTTVYYEKALEPNLPVFERELNKFLAGRERLSAIQARKGEIIGDIDRIVGVTDPNVAQQEKDFSLVVGMLSQIKLTFYLVRMPTTKDYLRGGGQLPGFSYDQQSDTVTYDPKIRVESGQKLRESYDLCLPIPPSTDFAQYMSRIFDGLAMFTGAGSANTAIHEVTELALMMRAKPTDPYWRWFSDGFANAITAVLIEKHVGKASADEFIKDYDPGRYRDLEKEVNLRYWMMGTYFPYVTDAPVEAENRISHARYAYSFFEARRLIDANGIDCVRRILDRIAARQSRTTADLLAVIKEATGQDMGPRLALYQTFDTAEQGLPKYTSAFQAAQRTSDWEKMTINVLRIMELRGDVYSRNNLQSFANIALFLFKMGKEEAGDAMMRRAIELFSRSPIEHGRETAMGVFMLYALECNHPAKAEKEADEMLRTLPAEPAPLAIKMTMALQRGNVSEAQALARQIQSRGGEQSALYKLAAQVLAIDPNRPKTYN
jgi:hypothetical protein